MAIFTQNAEGGTNTTVVTPANSATSGSAFTAVETPLTYSTEFAAHGTLSYKSSSTASSYARWALSGDKKASLRLYVRTATATAQDYTFARFTIGGTAVVQVRLQGTNQLRILGATGTVLWTAPLAFPITSFTRVEVDMNVGTTTTDGTLNVAYYAGDSTTALGSQNLAGVNLGGASGTLDGLYVFKYGGTTSITSWIDDVELRTGADSTGFIGPWVSPAPSPAYRWSGSAYVPLNSYRWDGVAYVALDRATP